MMNAVKTTLSALAVVAMSIGSIDHAKAEDCTEMLKPYFSYLATHNAKNVFHGPVSITLTRHQSGSMKVQTENTPSSVQIANVGFGYLDSMAGNTAKGVTNIWVSKGFKHPIQDDFLVAGPELILTGRQNTFSIFLTTYGQVTIAQQINGHNVGGMPAEVFQGICAENLITGVVHGFAYTLSLQPVTQFFTGNSAP